MLSIIIPVYNCEQYLNECLDSVLQYNSSDIEIICIDDCSTDNSLTVLKAKQKLDSRVKVIELPVNSGVSEARNTGINHSKGKYIHFLDSDDYVAEKCHSSLLDKLSIDEPDIAFFRFKKVDNEGQIISEQPVKKINIKAFEGHLVRNVIFKTEIIIKNSIRFVPAIHGEDSLFALYYMCFVRSSLQFDDFYYFYRIHQTQNTSPAIRQKKKVLYFTSFYEDILPFLAFFLKKNHLWETQYERIACYLIGKTCYPKWLRGDYLLAQQLFEQAYVLQAKYLTNEQFAQLKGVKKLSYLRNNKYWLLVLKRDKLKFIIYYIRYLIMKLKE